MQRFAFLAAVVCLAAVLAVPASAQDPEFTIEPSAGSALGGTAVKVTGRFGSWPYFLIFGERSVDAFRLDDTTLVAITPPGSGTVPVTVFEGDIGIAELQYTYVFDGGELERVLVPLLTPPIAGAHGAEFRTELRLYNNSARHTTIEGIGASCHVLCIGQMIELEGREELRPEDVTYAGTPGRFAYVPRLNADNLWMHLRVFDTSRSADNYGTTIPVVRERDMIIDRLIVFAGLPTDPRFRNTLRIYGVKDAVVDIEINDGTTSVMREVTLQGADGEYRPAYAQIGDLPTGAGPLRITIFPPGPQELGFGTPLWAFVSVTNNETQMITVVTP
jgi:hypothetical protein